MYMNLFKINELVCVYYLFQFIWEIMSLVVVSNNTMAIVVISSAYQLITSAQVYHSALC